jgi:hypothetical protein
MAIETIVAFVTVIGTDVLSAASVAVIFACPGATPNPRPVLAPTVNALVLSEDHVTTRVKSCVLPSLYVPIAVKKILVPCAMLPFAGWIAIELTLAAFTVREVLPVIPPNVALIVTVPRLRAVTSPLTVLDAILLLEECHWATLVMS